MYLMYPIPARAGTPETLSRGRCRMQPGSRFSRCLRISIMRMPRWVWNSRSIRLHSSRHWNTGGIMPVTSATAWTDLNLLSMMISASELPSGRPLQPVSLTASRPDADWIRSCSGRISQRCWTGTPQPPSRSLARLSVRSADRCCVRLKRLSE